MRTRTTPTWAGIAIALAVTVSCGGDDDAGATASSDAGPAQPTGNGDGGAFDADAPECDEIFALVEVEEWFGEPAQLTQEFEEGLGQLVCTWETVEDPEDLDDLAFQLITAQVFTGDPIPAENFVDPDIFEDITAIDGVGDLAFSEDSFGRSFYFLDGAVAGTFSYTDADIGDPDAEQRHDEAAVEAFFRQFHQRVTS